MDVRWLFGNFADPQYGFEPDEQRRLTRIAHERFMPFSTLARATVIMVVPTLVAMALIPRFMSVIGYGGITWAYNVATIAVILVFWVYSAWIYRSVYRRAMRRAMCAEGYRVCVSCGYRLDGHAETSGPCPECGRPIETVAPPADDDSGAE